MAFSTKALTLEQWLWCLFFGVGTLLWGQLVTTIPTRKIPKILSWVNFVRVAYIFYYDFYTSILRWGRGHPEEYAEAINLGGDDSRYDSMDDKKPRAGQILWIRGLTRLQTQVSNKVYVNFGILLLFKTQFWIYLSYWGI